ncbi:MAG: enoyl-CoA hydratase/isomerase family protein [Deltaproteobacteria bacterium]|nr:enoyl-CoA hydratase/isomerase family protein [Deltaproteobacteria bacterium]
MASSAEEASVESEVIIYEKKDRVATITLNRPERLNAINGVMSRELSRVWADVSEDPSVSVAIVTAAGEKSFCTGFDMMDAASTETADVGDEESRGSIDSIKFTAIQNDCWKPVITAVNGMVTGGGLHFVADSDLVVAAEHATFFDNHVRVGLASALEPVSLIRRLGMEAVLRMSFLGGLERMSAERALQLGLVGDVVPAQQLMPRALELAERISQHSPAALMASKRAIWESLNRGLDDSLAHAWEIITEHSSHPDSREGPLAFAERRKPEWQQFRKDGS